MKHLTHYKLLYCSLLVLSYWPLAAQTQTAAPTTLFDQDPVEQKTIFPGVSWQYYHFDNLFDSKQSVNVIAIDLSEAKLKADIAYLDTARQTTSSLAKANDALLAINGSFFDTKKGGSVVFFQEDHNLIDTTRLPNAYRSNGAVAIDDQGQIKILRRPAPRWKTSQSYEDVLSSGPLLIFQDQVIRQDSSKFNRNRHPRACIGITHDHQLILLTVDGRSAQAAGMSIPELAQLMKMLGCQEALNLDGGGSTTLWTQAQGVVNFPTDNKKYDHQGERGVANCIIFQEAN